MKNLVFVFVLHGLIPKLHSIDRTEVLRHLIKYGHLCVSLYGIIRQSDDCHSSPPTLPKRTHLELIMLFLFSEVQSLIMSLLFLMVNFDWTQTQKEVQTLSKASLSLGNPFLEFFFGLLSDSWPKVKNILHPACYFSQCMFLQSNTTASWDMWSNRTPHLGCFCRGFLICLRDF